MNSSDSIYIFIYILTVCAQLMGHACKKGVMMIMQVKIIYMIGWSDNEHGSSDNKSECFFSHELCDGKIMWMP